MAEKQPFYGIAACAADAKQVKGHRFAPAADLCPFSLVFRQGSSTNEHDSSI